MLKKDDRPLWWAHPLTTPHLPFASSYKTHRHKAPESGFQGAEVVFPDPGVSGWTLASSPLPGPGASQPLFPLPSP